MKVTGGKARSIPLRTPKGQHTRPATDAIREAVFSSLGALVENKKILDLFAGSGSYGFEAWSRGALACTFVENSYEAQKCLQYNIQSVSKSIGQPLKNCQALKEDVFRFLEHNAETYDLIFADPPYDLPERYLKRLLESAAKRLVLKEESRLILEIPGNIEPPIIEALEILKHRRKKKSVNAPSAAIFKPCLKEAQ